MLQLGTRNRNLLQHKPNIVQGLEGTHQNQSIVSLLSFNCNCWSIWELVFFFLHVSYFAIVGFFFFNSFNHFTFLNHTLNLSINCWHYFFRNKTSLSPKKGKAPQPATKSSNFNNELGNRQQLNSYIADMTSLLRLIFSLDHVNSVILAWPKTKSNLSGLVTLTVHENWWFR